MKKLAFFLVAAMLFAASAVQAKNEKISYKLQAGLNLSQITSPDYEDDIKDGVKPGFNLGFRFDYQFNDYLAVQTGLSYTMKGQKIKYNGDEDFEFTEKTTAHYFEIPILVGARYNVKDDIQLQFNTGPYLAIGLGGKVKENFDGEKYWGEFFGDPEKEDLDDDEFSPAGCKRFDMGWKFELGVDIKRYYVGLAYDLGFVDITNGDIKKANKDNDDYEPMKNRNFSINVGYRF